MVKFKNVCFELKTSYVPCYIFGKKKKKIFLLLKLGIFLFHRNSYKFYSVKVNRRKMFSADDMFTQKSEIYHFIIS